MATAAIDSDNPFAKYAQRRDENPFAKYAPKKPAPTDPAADWKGFFTEGQERVAHSMGQYGAGLASAIIGAPGDVADMLGRVILTPREQQMVPKFGSKVAEERIFGKPKTQEDIEARRSGAQSLLALSPAEGGLPEAVEAERAAAAGREATLTALRDPWMQEQIADAAKLEGPSQEIPKKFWTSETGQKIAHWAAEKGLDLVGLTGIYLLLKKLGAFD